MLFFCSHSLMAENVSTKDGINTSSREFPWALVINQGKIQGCMIISFILSAQF